MMRIWMRKKDLAIFFFSAYLFIKSATVGVDCNYIKVLKNSPWIKPYCHLNLAQSVKRLLPMYDWNIRLIPNSLRLLNPSAFFMRIPQWNEFNRMCTPHSAFFHYFNPKLQKKHPNSSAGNYIVTSSSSSNRNKLHRKKKMRWNLSMMQNKKIWKKNE